MNDIDEKGCYVVDEKHIYPNELSDFLGEPDVHVQIAYDWMVEQMSKRLYPPPEGVKYPIWAWVKQSERSWSSEHPGKPDMRSWITDKPEKVVRLQLEIPEEDILQTDFDLWHVHLNFAYFPKSEQDSDAWDKWLESHGLEYLDPSHLEDCRPEVEEAREMIYKSWKRLFNTDELENSYWGCQDAEKQCIQATFWVLKKEYIQSVEYFTTRNDATTRAKANEQAQRNRECLAKKKQQELP